MKIRWRKIPKAFVIVIPAILMIIIDIPLNVISILKDMNDKAFDGWLKFADKWVDL